MPALHRPRLAGALLARRRRVHVGAGSNVAGKRPPAANAAYFRTMAPFVRKHRPGLRGRVLAAGVWTAGEAGLLLTTVLPARDGRPKREVRGGG